ncbi:hypothetical protein [Mycobacterium kansasii]|uniref:hypothetical protein n=1 Tax=Mycobacterium kansasii TaxID=1768 RepID=UPI001CE2EFEA|nr:hypothetical protein [Mycobacterium kansasii]UCA22926.1 hypothetical protein LA359_28815 [Mycobacterium kansasii]
MHEDPLKATIDRLAKIDVDQLTDDQVIQLAQAQGTLTLARKQIDIHQLGHCLEILNNTVNRISATLDESYHKKYGKYPD